MIRFELTTTLHSTRAKVRGKTADGSPKIDNPAMAHD